jgi:hypothetical protein
MLQKIIPLVAAGVLIVATTFWEGQFTQRWAKREVTDVQKEFAARLATIPMEFGDWTAREIQGDERQLALAGAIGSFSRVYTSESTGAQVNVFFITGAAPDITKHTPDQCYAGAGYEMADEDMRYTVDSPSGPADYRTAVFVKRAPGKLPEMLRIFWSWSTDGAWTAPSQAQITFAYAPAIYKMYAISAVSAERQPAQEGPTVGFLREFLPEVDRALFKAPAPDESSPTPEADGSPDAGTKPEPTIAEPTIAE